MKLAAQTIVLLCFGGALIGGCARFVEKPLSPSATAEMLDMRSLNDPAFKAFLETNLGARNVTGPLTNLDFPTLTLVGFYFHPSLDVARAQWRVAQGGKVTAAGRPNPVLTATPGYSANAPAGISPWFPSVTLDVPLETAGKRRHRMAQSQHLSEAARLNIASAAWKVRASIRAALVDYTATKRRAELMGTNVALQRELIGLLEQRLAVGAAALPELTPARIALVRLSGDLAEARRRTLEERGRVAETLGLPLRALDGAEFSMALEQQPEADLFSHEVRREALQHRADILAALSEYAASQAALRLEIAKQYPDLHLSPGYQYDQGENKWQVGLSLELPVLNRNQGPIAEANAKRDEAAAKFIALQAKVISEIDRALLNQQAATEQLRQADDLIRVQQEQVMQFEISFKAGLVDLAEMAAARLEFATAKLTQLDALLRTQQAAGLLEEALQKPFEALACVERDSKTIRGYAKEKP